jgi:hypothetical protein
MRELTSFETDQVGGGLVSVSTGDINALNGISVGNGNSILSGNHVKVSDNLNDNLSGNTVNVSATVGAVLASLGLT